jgi:hypothetical protein
MAEGHEMKPTLLELHQNILSSMDGDEINSISDTVESRQVTEIIKTTYYNLVALGEFPRDMNIFQLQASGDPLLPVTMTLPADANNILWLKYDVHNVDQPNNVLYEKLTPMPFPDFVEMVTGFDPFDGVTFVYSHTVGANTWRLNCHSNGRPQFYTTADDGTILFDSYDDEVDTTLQGSKTMAYGQKNFPWTETDNFVLPLDDKQFARLLNEAKALAFAELKQSQHAKAEKTARDLKIDQQSSKTKVPLITDYDRVAITGRPSGHGRLKPTGRYK